MTDSTWPPEAAPEGRPAPRPAPPRRSLGAPWPGAGPTPAGAEELAEPAADGTGIAVRASGPGWPAGPSAEAVGAQLPATAAAAPGAAADGPGAAAGARPAAPAASASTLPAAAAPVSAVLAPPLPPVVETGHAAVDGALARLAAIHEVPAEARSAVYGEVHDALRDTLAELDERAGQGPTPLNALGRS